MPHEFGKLASLRVRGLGRIGGKVLAQRFSSNTHFTVKMAKMAKNGRFQRVDSQQLLVRFSCTFSRLSRITSNRSYLTCNPPSCGFVEMCCCDHEARFGTGNLLHVAAHAKSDLATNIIRHNSITT
jgi:hypothetical protein